LKGKWREIIVLTTSAVLGARVEYDFHVPFARDEGLSDAVIQAIGDGKAPPFADDGERIVYEANLQFLRTATLTPELREEAIKLLSYEGLMELIASVVLYIIVAYTTNVARVKLADDFSADPKQLSDFFTGKMPETK
jgi:4-carboxymuconolactone decarboxylase